jgi:hypothetical protein
MQKIDEVSILAGTENNCFDEINMISLEEPLHF